MSNPILKWAGGKREQAVSIIGKLRHGKRLVEPFVGGGAVWLSDDWLFDDFLLCDSNADLINLYQCVKDYDCEFTDYCQSFFTGGNSADLYYERRDRFNNHNTDEQTKAALFLYLNRHGFNGLCRYNSKGQFNVPFGKYKTVYFPRQEMVEFHKKARRATFMCQDFRETFAMLQDGDKVYCDPPYAQLTVTANFTSYTASGFSDQDQVDLATLAELSMKRVVISNHDTPHTREIYSKANEIIELDAARNISCDGANRGRVKELMAVYYER